METDQRGAVRERDAFQKRRRNRIILFIVLVLLLFGTMVFSVVVGQYTLKASDLPRLLAIGPGQDSIQQSVLWNIRLPRLVLGIIVGAALGVAGALMQAVFANPLAEPSVIGVTSGAGVGAAVVIVFNWTWLGTSTVPAAAFVTAVITTVAVYQLARHDGQVHVLNLILTGIAVNAVCGAAISLLVYIAPATSREQIIFWQMGSLNGAQWKYVTVVLPIIAVGIFIALLLGGALDILALGDKAAGHIGVNVQTVRIAAIGASTLLTAGAVAYAGLIGFVGLIIPHLLRGITGPSNKILMPASALAGAVLIGLSDVAARTLIAFADLPIGIFTAIVGGPTFFILLRRMMRRGRA
ncbi:iron ABC transporter permease [Corynebacterium sp. CCM 9185]|nr:iron ABC transporter permease [Corynebacterium marambiense]MCK7662218.1 iron ABC transporter permease [Corynebacterium marambiense]MCX7541487.1 iron ABC transporter permease [Corynebacterium marambiense]